ncbi:hypothetical protein NIT60_03770 [Mammaliicoccus sciuri]|nr:hypothetical protein NIT60_03770 [Mammaliicoccus sciuri]
MIKWLLFDKDGTLLKFDETWSEISLVMIDRFVEKYHIEQQQALQEAVRICRWTISIKWYISIRNIS